MKRMVLLILMFFSFNANGLSDRLHPLFNTNLELFSDAATYDDARSCVLNPAGIGVDHLINAYYSFSTGNNLTDDNLFLLQLGQGLGGGIRKSEFLYGKKYYDLDAYYLTFGFPLYSKVAYFGITWKWLNTNLPFDNKAYTYDLGFLLRPVKWLSAGGVINNVKRFSIGYFHNSKEVDVWYRFTLGIKPFTEKVILTYNLDYYPKTVFNEKNYFFAKYGLRSRIIDGVFLDGFVEVGSDISKINNYGIKLNLQFPNNSIGSSYWADRDKNRVNSFEAGASYERKKEAIEIDKNRTAIVEIKGELEEVSAGGIFAGGFKGNLHKIVDNLHKVAEAEDIGTVVLKIYPVSNVFIGSIDESMEEIKDAINRVKEKGKPVVAYLTEGASSGELFIALSADKIVIQDISGIISPSVAFSISRFRSTLKKLGIEIESYPVGKYKESFHSFTTDSATVEQKEAIQSLVDEMQSIFRKALKEYKDFTDEQIDSIVNSGIISSVKAKEMGLVDTTGDFETAVKLASNLIGKEKPEKVRVDNRIYWEERWSEKPVIAIIGAFGPITSGKSQFNLFSGSVSMGSETIARWIKQVSEDRKVKAIILRVNSPGGSAVASNEILEAIKKAKEKGKPVIVSMGVVSASGGYWISSMADKIVAGLTTITGSIGVIGGKLVLEELKDKIAWRTEVYKGSERADMFYPYRKFTEEEEKIFIDYLSWVYDEFVRRVSEGRKLDKERVSEIAQGRVWLGTQALENGLVDENGSLQKAIEIAGEITGIEEEYDLKWIGFKTWDYKEFGEISINPVEILNLKEMLWLRQNLFIQ